MSDRPIVLRSACIKLLSATEADPRKSHQHEFNGVAQLEQIFGKESFEREAVFSLRGRPSLTEQKSPGTTLGGSIQRDPNTVFIFGKIR